MGLKILEKLNIYTGLFVIGALFGLLIFVAGVEIKDLDLWLHLGVGKYIMLSGSVPQADIFNVVTTGHFWNNHEWLFQILVWNVFSQWGEQGLSNMQTDGGHLHDGPACSSSVTAASGSLSPFSR